MTMEPLAKLGNFFHIYDFRVKPGSGDDFIRLFNEFDYGDDNPMHKSDAQVKDGVLCRDVEDEDHFYLIGEWRDIEIHKEIRIEMVDMAPELSSWSIVARSCRSMPKSSPRHHRIFSTRHRQGTDFPWQRPKNS